MKYVIFNFLSVELLSQPISKAIQGTLLELINQKPVELERELVKLSSEKFMTC